MIDLWFDFSCPYAYLASQRAEALGTEVAWKPMLLGGVFRGTGAGDGPMKTLSVEKARNNARDMHRWADAFGVPFRVPAAHPMRTVRALRVLLALPEAAWPRAIHAIFAAYWQRGEDVTQDAVIAAALDGIPGVADAIARADSDAIKDELRARTDEAIALGIFGAPAWVLSNHLVWGQDRLAFVEAGIEGWDFTGPPPGGPRPFVATGTATPGATLDLFFDVASPFAYLALTQLRGFERMGVTPRLRPILLGALFRDVGQHDVPLFKMVEAKRRWFQRDMITWSQWWGVPLAFPRKFPQRTIAAQRLSIIAAREAPDRALELAITLGRGIWAEQQNLEDNAALEAIVEAAGFPREWVARTQDPAVKQALVDETAAAHAAGAFGVPSFVVNSKHLFWGQDRLDFVARALAGWDAP
ncbi:MAG TPA: 2-hydroxychromene-2-carboxylate isomerase [Kofleriaceae bacterium]